MPLSRRALLGTSLLLAMSQATESDHAQSAAAAKAPPGAPENFSVRTPDGLTLAAQAYGNPSHPEIVLIHGLRQSQLSWEKQVHSALASQFRIVTYDLRGHGDSDKPGDAAVYADGRRWGDDLFAVIQATKLRRPVLVGWSLGGLIIGHYLITHGSAGIAGINLVDAVVKFSAQTLTPLSAAFNGKIVAPDFAVRVQAIGDFLRVCFATPPTPAEFETMLTVNAMVPLAVQHGIGRIHNEGLDRAFAAVRVPTLVTHGEKDRLVARAMADFAVKNIPGAQLSLYDRAGHSPFFEDPQRFNRELAQLVTRAATL